MMLRIRAHLRYGGDFELKVDHEWPLEGVTGLFGRSGCGKTTLLRLIAGLERIRGAAVSFGDQQWQQGSKFVPLHRRRIGLVFQEHSLLPHLSVEDNLLYGYRRTPALLRRLHPPEVSAMLGIEDLLGRRIDQLSGGQRQRVALAGVSGILCTRPSLTDLQLHPARAGELSRLYPPQDHSQRLPRTPSRGRTICRPPFHQCRNANPTFT